MVIQTLIYPPVVTIGMQETTMICERCDKPKGEFYHKQNGNQWYDVIYAKIAGGPIYGSGAYQRDSGWYYYYTKDPNFVGKDIVKYQIVEKNTFRVLSNTATVTIISDGK